MQPQTESLLEVIAKQQIKSIRISLLWKVFENKVLSILMSLLLIATPKIIEEQIFISAVHFEAIL